MTKDEILRVSNEISRMFRQQGLRGSIDLSVRKDKWYYGGQTKFGDNVIFNDKYDEITDNEYDQFALFFSAFPEPEGGGNSHFNDCLYNCLHTILGEKLPWKHPIELKKYLNIPHVAKVHIKYIPMIEKKLSNIAINVTGDYCYTSQLKTNKVINLKLVNEHYTIYNKKTDVFKLHQTVSMDKERKPLLYDKSKFTGYDGEKEFFISQSLWHDIHNWKTDYILINRTNYDISIEEEYEDFIIKAQQLKEASEGKINLYKTGSDKITALNLFERYTKHISHPPIIEQVEADIINDASHGAIIFFDKYEGPAHKADIKSMYPSILKSGLCFPIGEGELKYIFELTEILQHGIYK